MATGQASTTQRRHAVPSLWGLNHLITLKYSVDKNESVIYYPSLCRCLSPYILSSHGKKTKSKQSKQGSVAGLLATGGHWLAASGHTLRAERNQNRIRNLNHANMAAASEEQAAIVSAYKEQMAAMVAVHER